MAKEVKAPCTVPRTSTEAVCLHCQQPTEIVGADSPGCASEHLCCGNCRYAKTNCTDEAVRKKFGY